MRIFDSIHSNFKALKVQQLNGRYITNAQIVPLLECLPLGFSHCILGYSELEKPIYGVNFGSGPVKILAWSQMHGNESTCTKAIFDAIFSFEQLGLLALSETITLKIIPILNPDGAECYTRQNSNGVDLNRDATDLTQQESRVLNDVFESFQPHFCFNMHDQRSIFSAGNQPKSATVSFLSPSEDHQRTVTPTRQMAMAVINQMNDVLQYYIPNQVGRYNDAFNINCVGDLFQSKGVPTILFEAGHFQGDYNRDETRQFILMAFLKALVFISNPIEQQDELSKYQNIPENKSLFYDILIKNARLHGSKEAKLMDIGVIFDEILIDCRINFIPKIEKFGDLSANFGHKTIDAQGQNVTVSSTGSVIVGTETFESI